MINPGLHNAPEVVPTLSSNAAISAASRMACSSSTKRISAFVRPQQTLHQGPPHGTNQSSTPSLLGFPARPDLPLHPLLPPPPSSDSFNATTALPTILPYHPAPMWASSNVFYHFALPHAHAPAPPPPPPIPPTQSSLLTELTSPPPGWSRPFHLPPPTGCTIAGCQDCGVISGGQSPSGSIASLSNNRLHFHNGTNSRLSSNISSTTTSASSPSLGLPSSSSQSRNRRKSTDSLLDNSDDPDSPASLHVESSSNSVGGGEGDGDIDDDEREIICPKSN